MKNILFVLCDQLRFDAIHAMGNPVIRTPTLDSLVERGISFSQAYTPCPVCVPARYSLHTGKMPHQTGVFENHTLPPEKSEKSFMNLLSEHGYQTFGAGKMHFTFPEGLSTLWGFDERRICDEDENLGNNDFYKSLQEAGYGHVCDYKGVRSEMYYIPQVSQLPSHLHHSHWTADECIHFLRRRDQKRPFFLMASFEKPHPPFEPPVPWNKLYRGPDMPLPKYSAHDDDLQTIWNKFQNRYKYRDQGTDLNLIRQIKAHYYAEVSFLDYNLGRLLHELEEQNILDDTLILFTADHGEMLGDYHCFGKRCFLDSAARIPLLLVDPSQHRSLSCDTPASLIDVFPTFLQYAGIPVPEGREGKNLLALADGEQREFVAGQYEQEGFANYMLLQKDFKYIYSAPDQKEYLFDRSSDPQELQNRATNSLYRRKTEELRLKLIHYFESRGYSVSDDGIHWRTFEKQELSACPDEYLLFQDPVASIPHIPGYSTPANQKENYEFSWLSKSFNG